MPLTPAQVETEIAKLNAFATRHNEALRRLTERIEALEKVAAGPQLARIADALNQFGSHHFAELQHQSLTTQPARPWKPV